MSYPAPSARLLASLRGFAYSKQFVCSSCISRRHATNTSRPLLRRSVGPSITRRASQIASVTSVNAPIPIPVERKELYDALKALEDSAAVYVNLSQLQLALRGLESGDSVTRVAVLGLNDQLGPRRLVRALLADPLNAEAEWEKLLESTRHGEKALLIRYGESLNLETGYPLLDTMTIPSTLLLQNKLEILIHQSGISAQEGELENNTLLVPTLDTPSLAIGRASTISYPVHKTILLGDGLGGLSQVAGLLTLVQTTSLQESVKLIVNVNWAADIPAEEDLLFVNMTRGEKAIKELRQSVQHSQDYEHDWLNSRISTIEPFLIGSSEAVSSIKPALRNLVSVLLTNVETAINTEESDVEQREWQQTIARKDVRQSIENAITSWAELAHTELRDELEKVFASRSWRKLAWWKLLWRVDDVDIVASEVLRRTYLINAEKNLIFLSGRMQEAGLFGPIPAQKEKDSQPLVYADAEDIPGLSVQDVHPAPLRPLDSLDGPKLDAQQSIEPDPTYRFPQSVIVSRLGLLQTTVPPLTALAQRYLLSSLSTTGLSAALSAFAYLSSSTTTLYEVGVILALGLTWSASRLQKQWELARTDWVQGVELEGKRVLDAVERTARHAVNTFGQTKANNAAIEDRSKAKEALEKAKEALANTDVAAESEERR